MQTDTIVHTNNRQNFEYLPLKFLVLFCILKKGLHRICIQLLNSRHSKYDLIN